MFFDKLQNDILGNSIVVYTDLDERVLLPKGSTALDAAFYLYGKQAWKLNKVYVNGSGVSLSKKVHEKDTLRFDFSEEKTIKSNWNHFSNTALALSLIKKGVS